MTWFLRPVRSPAARLRLFTFPYGGGGASIFRDWPGYFCAEVEVCPARLPGRETRICEKPFTRMANLIPELAVAVERYADLPFALFGHSMGALIAFELSRNLSIRASNLLQHVFVSSCRAPQKMPRDLRRHTLPDLELIAEMRRLGAPTEVLQNADLMTCLLPTMRADFELVDTYRYEPGPRMPCRVSAFAGVADPEVNAFDLAAWAACTESEMHVTTFPGDHFYIRDRAGLESLAGAISVDLSRYLRGASDSGGTVKPG